MKNYHISRRFVVATTVVVYLILAIVVIYHFWLKPAAPLSMVSPAVTETTQTIQKTLHAEYPLMDVYVAQDWQAQNIDGFSTSPALRMPDTTQVKSNAAPGLIWSWTDNNPDSDALYKNVAIALVNDGFSQDQSGQQVYSYGGVTTVYTTNAFHRGDEQCLFITSGVDPDTFDELRCYDNTTLQSQAALIQKFTTAYNVSSAKKKLDKIVQVRIASQTKGGVISASERAGYDIAEVSFRSAGDDQGYLALFYEHAGAWHYVTTATDEYGFSCGDMKIDPQARIALHDQVCYNFGPAPDDQLGTQRLDSSRHF